MHRHLGASSLPAGTVWGTRRGFHHGSPGSLPETDVTSSSVVTALAPVSLAWSLRDDSASRPSIRSSVEGIGANGVRHTKTNAHTHALLLSRVRRALLAANCSAVSMVFAIAREFSSSRESFTVCCTANQEVTMTATTSSMLTSTMRTPKAARLSSSPASTLIRSARKLLKKMITQPCGSNRTRPGWYRCDDACRLVL